MLRTICAVIPTLNETVELPETIARLCGVPEIVRIVVADGGSDDGTPLLASELGCEVVNAPRGRGTQMRRGAQEAREDIVLLLHADTWLSPEAGRAILRCFSKAGVVGGGCYKVFREPSWVMRGSRLKCALRFHLFRRSMGDQAMFVRRDVLEAIGGVPDVPLMEEFELCRSLRRVGRLVLAPTVVSTSGRRFKENGVLRTYLRMWRVTLKYYRGTPPDELSRLYNKR